MSIDCHKKNGFTLIELLVVISLIGILAALALVSYAGTQKQARDVQRKSDLKQYQNALEIYAAKNDGLYPSFNGRVVSLCNDLELGSNCPGDPRYDDDNTFDYNYQSNNDATEYVLWEKLENTSDYWVICSFGKIGAKAQSDWSDPTQGSCPISTAPTPAPTPTPPPQPIAVAPDANMTCIDFCSGLSMTCVNACSAPAPIYNYSLKCTRGLGIRYYNGGCAYNINSACAQASYGDTAHCCCQ